MVGGKVVVVIVIAVVVTATGNVQSGRRQLPRVRVVGGKRLERDG